MRRFPIPTRRTTDFKKYMKIFRKSTYNNERILRSWIGNYSKFSILCYSPYLPLFSFLLESSSSWVNNISFSCLIIEIASWADKSPTWQAKRDVIPCNSTQLEPAVHFMSCLHSEIYLDRTELHVFLNSWTFSSNFLLMGSLI